MQAGSTLTIDLGNTVTLNSAAKGGTDGVARGGGLYIDPNEAVTSVAIDYTCADPITSFITGNLPTDIVGSYTKVKVKTSVAV